MITQAYGGDRIECRDGTIGVVRSTKIRLYASDEDGTSYTIRDDSGTDHEVRESLVVRVLEHGRHEYYKGPNRGHCRRCGVKKGEHA